MIAFLETIRKISDSLAGNDIPPIMRGTKSIIQKMAVEERKIAEMNQAKSDKIYSMIREREDISSIFTKYVNQNFNKEVYLFIK